MFLEKAVDDVGAECEGYAPVVLAPACHFFVGVRPEEVAEKPCAKQTRGLIGGKGYGSGVCLRTCVWDVCGPHDTPDLVHALQVGTEPAVHGEDLLVDDSSNGQAIEAVGERLPDFDVISTFA